MSEPEKIETYKVMRAPNHKKFYVTNVVGGLTDQDFRVELLNEKVKDDKNADWNYISDAMIIMTPIGAKRLLGLLKSNIEVYESEFGEISLESKDKHIIDINKK